MPTTLEGHIDIMAPEKLVISGLHIDIKSAELKQMLLGRVGYHKEKIALYERQLEQQKQVHASLQADAEESFKTQSMGGPMESLQRAIEKHRGQVTYFDFVSSHLAADATYRLDENDLSRLGFERHY